MEVNRNILLAAGLGFIFSDIIPTPGDALYFKWQRQNRDKFIQGQIDYKRYNINELLIYYLPNAAWWALVTLVVLNTKVSAHDKLKLGLGIIGAGAVITVIWKNMQKDKETGEILKSYNIKYD